MRRISSIVMRALAASVGVFAGTGSAQVAPGGPVTPYVDPAKAYLFAHMTKEQYGVLYYSVSLDGLHWRRINAGRPVSAD